MTEEVVPTSDPLAGLYDGVRMLIESARTQAATLVNQTLVLTYWRIGKTIKTEVLDAARGQYGASILKQLAWRLTQEFGNGFSYSALTSLSYKFCQGKARVAKFYAAAPDHVIVATLSQQLSWSHFVELIKPDDDLKRQFYTHLCADVR